MLVIVCIVVGAPVWISGLLGILFNWAWAWAVFAALLAFWWLPGVPYFALCVAVTLAIKRFFEKKAAKKAKAKGIAEISKDLEEISEGTGAKEDN